MAKEILVIDRGQVVFFLLYGTPPIVISGQPQILTQASNQLPLLAQQITTAQEKSLIDGGRVVWESGSIPKSDNETNQQYVNRLKKKWQNWSDRQDARIQKWAQQIANATWINV